MLDDPHSKDDSFTWDAWLKQGFSVVHKSLSRYGFGLPEAFWSHLETAFHELLAAGRIFFRTWRDRQHGPVEPPKEARGPIDIEWE